MNQVKKSAMQLHIDHQLWASELKYFKEEFSILDKYLLEVAKKNTVKDAMPGLEQHQNKFILQREILDELLHEVNEHEKELAVKVKGLNEIQAEKMKLDDHEGVRDRVQTFKKLYTEYKQELLDFIGQWM